MYNHLQKKSLSAGASSDRGKARGGPMRGYRGMEVDSRQSDDEKGGEDMETRPFRKKGG